MQGVKEAEDYLQKNRVNLRKIDYNGYIEAYVKQHLASGMRNNRLWELANGDMMEALNLKRDKIGRAVLTVPKSPPISSYLELMNEHNLQRDRFTKTVLTKDILIASDSEKRYFIIPYDPPPNEFLESLERHNGRNLSSSAGKYIVYYMQQWNAAKKEYNDCSAKGDLAGASAARKAMDKWRKKANDIGMQDQFEGVQEKF